MRAKEHGMDAEPGKGTDYGDWVSTRIIAAPLVLGLLFAVC
jgi:hypothetical protein